MTNEETKKEPVTYETSMVILLIQAMKDLMKELSKYENVTCVKVHPTSLVEVYLHGSESISLPGFKMTAVRENK